VFEPELATRALSLCIESALSVSQLSNKMRGNHAKLIDLIRELQSRGLLSRMIERRGKGRPLCLLRTTPLGEQFIEEYHRLLNLRLYSNDNDLRKALDEADHVRALLEQHVAPYAQFQEVNKLARNIAHTAQTSRDS
jgi:DNA-binding PadR family transcriptional regulator